MSTFDSVSTITLERQATVGKDTQGIQTGKEKVEQSLFADSVIMHIENPKQSIKNLLGLSEFSKATGYRSIYDNQWYFHILAMNTWKMEF